MNVEVESRIRIHIISFLTLFQRQSKRPTGLNGHLSILAHIKSLIFPNMSKAKKKKYMCVYCHLLKKNRVGRSDLIFSFFFILKFIEVAQL
jgi:hypothetical protein